MQMGMVPFMYLEHETTPRILIGFSMNGSKVGFLRVGNWIICAEFANVVILTTLRQSPEKPMPEGALNRS
jgi:hypothetical protein